MWRCPFLCTSQQAAPFSSVIGSSSALNFCPPALTWAGWRCFSLRATARKGCQPHFTKSTASWLADAAPKPKPSEAKDSASRQGCATACVVADGWRGQKLTRRGSFHCIVFFCDTELGESRPPRSATIATTTAFPLLIAL